MVIEIEALTTCDNCARLFYQTVKKYYCEHCDKYFYICPACVKDGANCRYCGIPLKRSSEKLSKLVMR